MRKNCLYYLAFIILIFIAALLRVHQLGVDPVWVDEGYTGFVALNSTWLPYILVDNSPPLYYFIQRLYCHYLACGEVGLRTSSVVFGIAFIIILMFFLNQRFGKAIALLTGFIVSISSLHIYYSQEARAYSLMLLLLLLFYVFQHKVLQQKTVFNLIALFLITLAASFTHYFAPIAISGCLIVYFFEARYQLRAIPKAYFITVLLALSPIIVWFFYC